MFDAKEEKASFKLENESQPNIRHFGDRYIYILLGACMWLSGKCGLVALSGDGLMRPGSRAMYLGGRPGSLKWQWFIRVQV